MARTPEADPRPNEIAESRPIEVKRTSLPRERKPLSEWGLQAPDPAVLRGDEAAKPHIVKTQGEICEPCN